MVAAEPYPERHFASHGMVLYMALVQASGRCYGMVAARLVAHIRPDCSDLAGVQMERCSSDELVVPVVERKRIAGSAAVVVQKAAHSLRPGFAMAVVPKPRRMGCSN